MQSTMTLNSLISLDEFYVKREANKLKKQLEQLNNAIETAEKDEAFKAALKDIEWEAFTSNARNVLLEAVKLKREFKDKAYHEIIKNNDPSKYIDCISLLKSTLFHMTNIVNDVREKVLTNNAESEYKISSSITKMSETARSLNQKIDQSSVRNLMSIITGFLSTVTMVVGIIAKNPITIFLGGFLSLYNFCSNNTTRIEKKTGNFQHKVGTFAHSASHFFKSPTKTPQPVKTEAEPKCETIYPNLTK